MAVAFACIKTARMQHNTTVIDVFLTVLDITNPRGAGKAKYTSALPRQPISIAHATIAHDSPTIVPEMGCNFKQIIGRELIKVLFSVVKTRIVKSCREILPLPVGAAILLQPGDVLIEG